MAGDCPTCGTACPGGGTCECPDQRCPCWHPAFAASSPPAAPDPKPPCTLDRCVRGEGLHPRDSERCAPPPAAPGPGTGEDFVAMCISMPGVAAAQIDALRARALKAEAERDEAHAKLRVAEERIALQGAIVREARWFSVNVYPPDVWLPDPNPPDHLGGGEKAAKRMNAALAALTGWKQGKPSPCYDCHDNLAIKNTAVRARDAAEARASAAEASLLALRRDLREVEAAAESVEAIIRKHIGARQGEGIIAAAERVARERDALREKVRGLAEEWSEHPGDPRRCAKALRAALGGDEGRGE